MKKIIVMIALFTISIGYAQGLQKVNNKVVLNSLKYTINSYEDFKKIDWDGLKEFAEGNEEDELISLELAIKIPKSKKGLKRDYTYKVTGKSKDIEKLIRDAKKVTKSMSTITSKHMKINLK